MYKKDTTHTWKMMGNGLQNGLYVKDQGIMNFIIFKLFFSGTFSFLIKLMLKTQVKIFKIYIKIN